jgi:acyl-CoA synthetase (AMP-forming)/AMP-acid ligase II
VVGVPDPDWGEAGVAYVVVKAPGPTAPDEEALGRFLAAHLARYKLPRRYMFMLDLPRTAAGKVDRLKLGGGRHE